MLEIIIQFVRRMLMGKGKGILRIAPKKDVDKFAEDLHKTFKKHGIPDSAVKNPNDVKVIWNQITNKESQVLSTTLDDILKGPVTVRGPKGDRIWDFSKKKGDVVDLFASEKEFGDDLYSIGQNLIKNDPKFNLELATTYRNPGTKTYSAYGSGKLHSPAQRQKILDKLKGIMKHDTYQAQHGEELGFVDLTDDIFTIEKASGGRIGRYEGGIAPLVGEPSYAANFYDDRTPYATGNEVYGPPPPKKKEKKKKEKKKKKKWWEIGEQEKKEKTPQTRFDPFWYYGLRFPAEAEAGKTVDPTESISFDSFGDVDVDFSDPRFKIGKHDPQEEYHPFEFEVGKDSANITLRKRFDEGGIMRAGMAGGGALFKFIEKLFIKASNDIRLGRGKWKGLDQKQRIVQHDNLTKKVVEFQKSGNTEGLEVYFGVNPNEAFAAASQKATRLGKKGPHWKEQEVKGQMDEIAGGMDERTMLKQKYPGVSDDLLNKILIDDNPQRKAEVLATMDEYLKLLEIGKGEEEAFNILTKDIKKPTKHAEGGRADFIFGGSAGLKAMWKNLLKNVSKGRDKPVTKFFPKLSVEEKEMLELGKKYTPRESTQLLKGEKAAKIEGIDILIERLKNDKDIIARQAKNRARNDPSLNFLMKHLETDMPEVYGPHLKKYTDIDRDILQMENIKKNLIMKDRKLNAEGGRVSYTKAAWHTS